MRTKLKKILIFFILILVIGVIFLWRFDKKRQDAYKTYEVEAAYDHKAVDLPPEKTDRVEKVDIIDGTTYAELMTGAGLEYGLAMELYEAAKPYYDLVKVRAGKFIELVYDKDTDEFKELRYKIDTEDELFIWKQKLPEALGEATSSDADAMPEWIAEMIAIPYEVKVVTKEGVIESSMYETALEKDIDIRAIIELADAFQWTIDFAMDPRKGDTFKFIYEERYLDGEYVMPGQVLAGYYINAGEKYSVYYFEEAEDNIGFFDQDGNSVQKMFLKAPVAFKYISSGFTTGSRYIEAFNISTGHRAVDYAAALGTPIRAVGNGTITFAGWGGAYGNKISVRHNGTYSTNYCHLSKFAVKSGQKVTQSQVIGYVGSTGLSTGPHLHYEMVKNGVKVNALKEVLPPGKPIKEENRERFFEEVKKWDDKLNG